jgi:alpha-L-fucosidase
MSIKGCKRVTENIWSPWVKSDAGIKKGRSIKISKLLIMAACTLLTSGCTPGEGSKSDIPPMAITPSPLQVEYQQMEVIGFLHFSINTFTGREWGGIKELILTAKHHDGFCLWPSAYTEHSIRNSPYMNGEGDLVAEFTDACRKHGIKPGLYLSPWDRNHRDYGRPEYIEYYRNQIRELLTNYGNINEIWFDGANGGDGYYGGANEIRVIERERYYDWENTFKLVKELQPEIMIFSDAGPDIRWTGNEQGIAGETFWSTIDAGRLVPGVADQAYLNSGDPDGTEWITGQCDVSIRPGWFYRPEEDSLVKSAEQLVDIYYKSVGRNAVMLLNMPPDRRGVIHENDVAALMEFRQIIDATFSIDFTTGASVRATSQHMGGRAFSPENIIDDNSDSYWAAGDSVTTATITLKHKKPVTFDRIMISEPVRLGQRVISFSIEANDGNGWREIARGTTIGHKRLFRIEPVTAKTVRIHITESMDTPAISEFGLYLYGQNRQLRTGIQGFNNTAIRVQ